MKSLQQYILEAEDKQDPIARGDIKFTIWESPKKKLKWLSDNNNYQKIEYQYKNTEKNIFIDFLLGFKDNSWQLWAGKIGKVTYDNDSYYDLKTTDFATAINDGIAQIEKMTQEVIDDPMNYVQYYKDIPTPPAGATGEGGDEGGDDLM